MNAIAKACCAGCLLLVSVLVGPATAGDFELTDGDRVVLLGDGLIEQEQYFGWVELMMTTAFPDRHVTFRNKASRTPFPERCSIQHRVPAANWD